MVSVLGFLVNLVGIFVFGHGHGDDGKIGKSISLPNTRSCISKKTNLINVLGGKNN